MSQRKQRVRVDKIVMHWENDPMGDTGDEQGVYAVAHVSYELLGSNGARRLERFKSGGLWGIDQPLERDYRAELESEQLDELRDHLAVFGIKPKPAEWLDLRRRATDMRYAHAAAFRDATGATS